jgi:hypothetical protein
MQLNFDISKISSILFRELPSVRYDFTELSALLTEKTILSYFKGVRSLNEYPGLYNFLKSRGFDISLCDEIRSSKKHAKEKFFKNISDIYSHTTNESNFLGLCSVHNEHIKFISYRLAIDIYPVFHKPLRPKQDDILSATRLSTSIGLPNPTIRKRDYLDNIRFAVNSFYSEKLSIKDTFLYPSATFLRTQIRLSGIKMRVVHAVYALQLSIESFYYQYMVSSLPSDSSITIGRTQLEISKIVSKYKGYHTYCFDHNSWDTFRQPVLSVISFEIIKSVLPLSIYESKILNLCRNYYLTLPMFHPSIPISRRFIGTVSGSGFTSLDNSFSNWILMTILIFNYCKRNGMDPYKFDYLINVCGDDLIMGFKQPINSKSIMDNASSQFGCSMRLEIPVQGIGTDYCFFLGSTWKNGLPFRKEKQLVASVIFGSGNFPMMDTDELLQSRFMEVFGNSSDAYMYWKRLRVVPIKRIFFFNELFTQFQKGQSPRFQLEGLEELSGKSKDSRGFWFSFPETLSALSNLWKTR